MTPLEALKCKHPEEEIEDKAVRDICSVAVSGAPKSKIREIVRAALKRQAKEICADIEKEYIQPLGQGTEWEKGWNFGIARGVGIITSKYLPEKGEK